MSKLHNQDSMFTPEEVAYRRGFHQGFWTAKNTKTKIEKVREWRYSDDEVGAPGTPKENSFWPGKKKTIEELQKE